MVPSWCRNPQPCNGYIDEVPTTGNQAVEASAPPTASAKRAASFAGVRRRFDQAFDVADPADTGSRPIALIVWAVWAIVVLALIITHDPWRDELQAWGLARASGTPIDVIFNIRHEGHPPTWYLLLWPVAKIIPSTIGLQIVVFFVGVAATGITLLKMPVSLWLRSAIVFSYFPLFELGTISRSYSLTWLLVVVALWLTNRTGTANWIIALVLVALAGTTVLAIPLAVAIAIGIWGGPWFASRERGPLNLAWMALFVVVPAAIAAIAVPASGGGPAVNLSKLSPTAVWDAFASVLRAAFPVTNSDDAFWGRFVVLGWTTWGPILGAAFVIALAWSVRRSRTALTVWVLSTSGYIAMLAITQVPMAPRLVSPLWSGAIAAIWFAAVDRRSRPVDSRPPISIITKLGIVFLLSASLWASAWAAWIGTAIPFTTAAAAADWIKAEADGNDFVILCVINAPMCSSVSIRLDVPAYSSANGKSFAFVDWNAGWSNTIRASEVPGVAAKLAARTGAEVFIVAPTRGYPLGCQNGLAPPPRVVTEYLLVCRADQLVTFPVD
jgi:hypothetical protein